MSEFKLHFSETKQTYQYMDFIETKKGGVRQIISNLNIALMNPKYCLKEKLYQGQIFYDSFAKEIKFQGKIIGEKGVNPNKIRLWDDTLNNRLGLETEKHFGINYNANKMWEAVRFVASQYSISPPKQFLEQLIWNGDKNAIRKLLPTYLGTEDTDLNAWIMEHTLFF